MDQVTQVKTQLRLEHWKQLISECQASGMSICSWRKENNVFPHMFEGDRE